MNSRRRRFIFSLRTLVLLSLLAGASLFLKQRWSPWEIAARPPEIESRAPEERLTVEWQRDEKREAPVPVWKANVLGRKSKQVFCTIVWSPKSFLERERGDHFLRPEFDVITEKIILACTTHGKGERGQSRVFD